MTDNANNAPAPAAQGPAPASPAPAAGAAAGPAPAAPAPVAPALPAADASLMGSVSKGADLGQIAMPVADSSLLGSINLGEPGPANLLVQPTPAPEPNIFVRPALPPADHNLLGESYRGAAGGPTEKRG